MRKSSTFKQSATEQMLLQVIVFFSEPDQLIDVVLSFALRKHRFFKRTVVNTFYKFAATSCLLSVTKNAAKFCGETFASIMGLQRNSVGERLLALWVCDVTDYPT